MRLDSVSLVDLIHSLCALLNNVPFDGIQAIKVAVLAILVVESTVPVKGQFDFERSGFLQSWHSQFIEQRVFYELSWRATKIWVELEDSLDDLLELRIALLELFVESALFAISSNAVEIILGRLVRDKACVNVILVA